MSRFEGKTVVVTGAGSGIGAATAIRFASEGANVVLAGRTRSKLEETAAAIGNDRTLVVTADVAQWDEAQALAAAALERFGAVDVLVNNAGSADMGLVDEIEIDAWHKVIETNVDGVFLVTRAFWDALKQSKGNVVNLSSVSGIGGDWEMFAYNASKGAVSNMTRALALDIRKTGVRVNAVAPSLTATDMASGVLGKEETKAKFFERIPMGRAAEPAEIAAAIAFLASDDAGFVNGVVLPVDGGVSASNGQPPLR